MKSPIVVIVGTRPDALKLIPVYIALKRSGYHVYLCATNQHRELLDQVFNLFDVTPDIELHIMKASQDLDYVTRSVLEKTTALFKSLMPCMVIVQGDTTSSFAAALAAYYLSVPVAHVEAGLRTGNIYSPFPEEINRSFIAKISALHFAPTPLNLLNLLNEGVSPSRAFYTGNTIVDVLYAIKQRIDTLEIVIDQNLKDIIKSCKKKSKKIILLTTHRRESFDGGLLQILTAVSLSAQKYPDLFFIFPVHPNPNVADAVQRSGIRERENVFCCPPILYQDLIFLLSESEWVMTDSGGIQEEAVSLGKRVMILRNYTERIEAVWERIGRLTGSDIKTIVSVVDEWYSERTTQQVSFIYGDGLASEKIVDILKAYLEKVQASSFQSSEKKGGFAA